MGHTDAVWSLSYLGGNHQQLLSASADGTVKLWSPITKSTSNSVGPQQLVKTFGYSPTPGKWKLISVWFPTSVCENLQISKPIRTNEILHFVVSTAEEGSGNNNSFNIVPTAVDWVYEDPSHMVTGYSNAACIIYDIETGKSVVRMDTLQVQ